MLLSITRTTYISKPTTLPPIHTETRCQALLRGIGQPRYPCWITTGPVYIFRPARTRPPLPTTCPRTTPSCIRLTHTIIFGGPRSSARTVIPQPSLRTQGSQAHQYRLNCHDPTLYVRPQGIALLHMYCKSVCQTILISLQTCLSRLIWSMLRTNEPQGARVLPYGPLPTQMTVKFHVHVRANVHPRMASRVDKLLALGRHISSLNTS